MAEDKINQCTPEIQEGNVKKLVERVSEVAEKQSDIAEMVMQISEIVTKIGETYLTHIRQYPNTLSNDIAESITVLKSAVYRLKYDFDKVDDYYKQKNSEPIFIKEGNHAQ